MGDLPVGGLQGLATLVHEEGPNSYWNPGNIEYHPGDNSVFKGVSDFNSVGVQMYAGAEPGAKAFRVWFTQSRWLPVANAAASGSYAATVQALTRAYTWAPYNPGTQAQAEATLDSVMPGTDQAPLSGGATPITGDDDMSFTLDELFSYPLTRPDGSKVSYGACLAAIEQYTQSDYQSQQSDTSFAAQTVAAVNALHDAVVQAGK